MSLTVSQHEMALIHLHIALVRGDLVTVPGSTIRAWQIQDAIYNAVLCIQAQRETNERLARKFGVPVKSDFDVEDRPRIEGAATSDDVGALHETIASLKEHVAALQGRVESLLAHADRMQAAAEESTRVEQKTQERLMLARERIVGLSRQIRALESGRAVRALIDEVDELRLVNLALKKKLEEAEAGERVRSRRAQRDQWEPPPTIEGVTYGSPQIRRRRTLSEGSYQIERARGAE